MDKITGAIKYEYQMLRYRHDAVSGEFVNIGIVFFDAENRFLKAKVSEKYGRISRFFGHVSGTFLLKTIKNIEQEFNALGKRMATETGFPIPNQVRDITNAVLPVNDNGLFFSDVLKGWHLDQDRAFNETYDRLIGQYSEEATEQRHDDNYAWKKVYKHFFDENNITPQLKDHNVVTATDVIEFEHAAKNGVWHCFQPISFDLKKKGDIKEKIYRWAGIIGELQTAEEPLHLYLLSLMPDDPQLQRIIEQKLTLNQPNLTVQLIKEEDALAMVEALKPLLTEH
jgi:Protein of unknown function (DUF3037)